MIRNVFLGEFDKDLKDVFSDEMDREAFKNTLKTINRLSNHLELIMWNNPEGHEHTLFDAEICIDGMRTAVNLLESKLKEAAQRSVKKTEKEERELLTQLNSVQWNGAFEYDCCRNCNNNPRNNPHASGICNCMLPYLEATRPKTGGNPVSYYDTYTTTDTQTSEKKCDFANMGEAVAHVGEILNKSDKIKNKKK